MITKELIKAHPEYKIIQCDINNQVVVLLIVDKHGNGMMVGSTNIDNFEENVYKVLTVGAPSLSEVKDILKKFTK